MIGSKMVGTVLAPMIADIKRVSQAFLGFKSVDMLEIPNVMELPKNLWYIADISD